MPAAPLRQAFSSRSLSSSLLFLALTAHAAGYRQDGPKWLVLLVLCAVAAAWVKPALDRINLALACFLGWAGLSMLWSPDLGPAAVQMFGLLAFAMLFLFGRSGFDFGFPAALSLGPVLVFWLLWDETGYMGNPNFAAEYAVAALPFALALKRPWARRPLAGASLMMATLSESRTGLFALWVVSVGWLWQRDRWLAAILFMVPVNLAAFGVIDITDSAQARLELWIDTAAMWLDSPLLGTGAGGFDYTYPKWDAVHLQFFPAWGFYHPIQTYAGAAHNEALQLLAELGLIGFGLAGWFLYEVRKRGAWRGGPAWALGLGGATCLIGFPLQNPCTLALMALSLGAVAGEGKSCSGLSVRLGRAVAAYVFLAGAVFMLRTMQAQWVYQGVVANFMTNPAAAVAANVRAYEIAPWDFKVRYQMYPTLAKAGTQKNVVVKPSAYEKAWRISTSASPDSRYLKSIRSTIDGG